MIYVCIPVYNRISLTLACINSLNKQTFKDIRIIICDDGSQDNTSEIIRSKYEKVILLRGDGNLWWSGSMNKCAEYALCEAQADDFIYTLNNDTELYPKTLEKVYKTSIKYKKSIIGTCNVFFDNENKIEPSAFYYKHGRLTRINKWGADINIYRNKIIPVSALSGKGVLIPVGVFKNIGLYNAKLLPHYHADTEFTFRAYRAGYSVLLDYGACLKSHQHLSGIGSRTSEPSIKDFFKSFFNLKSTHHFLTLKNWNKLIHPKHSWFYLILDLAGITFGFIKRYFLSKLK